MAASVLGLAVAAGAVSLGLGSTPTGTSTVGVAPDARPAPFVIEPAVRFEPAEPPAASDVPAPATPRAHPARGLPTRVFVPRVGVDAPVIGIDAPDGVLLPPSDPQVLGWWRVGALPGDAQGSALITGHTVSVGGGVFDDLEHVRVGDRVRVRTTAGSIAYRITGVTIYRKAALAQDSARIFSQTVPGRLVLITCEDWNGTAYLSNVVVFADPLPDRDPVR